MGRRALVVGWAGRGLAALLFLPLLYLVATSLSDGGAAWKDAAAGDWAGRGALLGRTLVLACGGGAIACALGAGAALLFERRRFPLAGFWRASALAALVCPPVFQVAVWERLASPGGVLARLFPFAVDEAAPFPIRNAAFACWLLGVTYSPIFFFLVGTGLRSVPEQVLEAARLHHRERIIHRRITLPLTAPWFVAAWGVSFPLLFLNYEVPRLLDLYTYPVLIHVEYGAKSNPAAAFAVAAPVLLLTILVLLPCMSWAQRRGFALTGRETTALGKRQGALRPGLSSWCAFGGWWLLVAALPVGTLFSLAGGTEAFERAWMTDHEKLGWSALVAGGTACCAVVLSLLVFASRGGPSARIGVGYWVLLAVPGSLLAFALVAICRREPLFSLYDSWGILVVVDLCRFFPLGYYSLAAHLRTVPGPQWEASRFGVSVLRRWSVVRLPLLAPGLVAGAVAVTLFASREISAAVFLAPPGQEPLIVRIYNLLHYDPERDVLAALALFQMAVILGVAAAFVGLCRLALKNR